MPTYDLDTDYPMLWTAAGAVDEADKMGRSNLVLPLHREIEEALHELWMARGELAS